MTAAAVVLKALHLKWKTGWGKWSGRIDDLESRMSTRPVEIAQWVTVKLGNDLRDAVRASRMKSCSVSWELYDEVTLPLNVRFPANKPKRRWGH